MTRADAGLAFRFGALAFAVLAIVLAVAQLDREAARETGVAAGAAVAPDEGASDPLSAELARCRALTDPAAVDEACRRAWAERRARFFEQPKEARR